MDKAVGIPTHPHSLRLRPVLVLFLVGSVLSLVLAPTPGHAASGDEILAKMDEAMTRAEDQFFEYDVVHTDPGKAPKLMTLRVWIKGQMRITEFLAPGDMKGTKALVRSRTQMYLYLPAYNKIRRVASHATKGGFLGTTFSNEDISTTTYGDVYAASSSSEEDGKWTVEATPREGIKAAYGKLVFIIGQELMLPIEIRYFNAKGQHTKTETRTEYGCKGNICNAGVMRMLDHSKNGAWTELRKTAWKVNTGLSDAEFSLRRLQP